MANSIQILQSKPGIQRDGTTFNSDCYTDGVWCRFYLGMPRKIGGYVMLTYGSADISLPSNGIIRSLMISDGIAKQKQSRFYLGRTKSLATIDYAQGQIKQAYIESDVTPPTQAVPVGYTTGWFQPYPTSTNPNLINLWSFESFTTQPGTDDESPYIIAHVAPNANDVANTESGDATKKTVNVFYQTQELQTQQFLPLFVSTPKSPGGTLEKAGVSPVGCVTPPYTNTYAGGQDIYNDADPPVLLGKSTPIVGLYPSGGIVAVYPFLFIYGASGVVAWSSPGNPSEFPSDQIDSIAGTKIVVGKNTRGSGTATVLFWSLDSVILGQFSPVTSVIEGEEIVTNNFSFNVLRDDVSILSAACVVEYNQNFYWVGSDQFYVYTGVVQQLPNTMSTDWFFNNINPAQTSKVWGLAIPRYNEIWWYYPRGNATECTDVIIFNVLTNTWYDAVSSRAAGNLSRLSPSPYMTDSALYTYQGTPGYGLWQHEIGVDQVYLNQEPQAILSSFTTSVFNLGVSGQSDAMILTRRIEPDFSPILVSSQANFTNPMTVQLLTRAYANSPLVSSPVYAFDNQTPYVDLLIQGGLVQYVFQSNIVGGSYQTGKILLTYSEGDVRRG